MTRFITDVASSTPVLQNERAAPAVASIHCYRMEHRLISEHETDDVYPILFEALRSLLSRSLKKAPLFTKRISLPDHHRSWMNAVCLSVHERRPTLHVFIPRSIRKDHGQPVPRDASLAS